MPLGSRRACQAVTGTDTLSWTEVWVAAGSSGFGSLRTPAHAPVCLPLCGAGVDGPGEHVCPSAKGQRDPRDPRPTPPQVWGQSSAGVQAEVPEVSGLRSPPMSEVQKWCPRGQGSPRDTEVGGPTGAQGLGGPQTALEQGRLGPGLPAASRPGWRPEGRAGAWRPAHLRACRQCCPGAGEGRPGRVFPPLVPGPRPGVRPDRQDQHGLPARGPLGAIFSVNLSQVRTVILALAGSSAG